MGKQITENKEEIQNLKNVAQARINDNRKIYETITSKNEDIETLQNRVLVLEKEVRRKHREMEAHKADLITSRQEIRQKEGVHVESISAWQDQCSKLQDRITELEEENDKNKGKRRRL